MSCNHKNLVVETQISNLYSVDIMDGWALSPVPLDSIAEVDGVTCSDCGVGWGSSYGTQIPPSMQPAIAKAHEAISKFRKKAAEE